MGLLELGTLTKGDSSVASLFEMPAILTERSGSIHASFYVVAVLASL